MRKHVQNGCMFAHFLFLSKFPGNHCPARLSRVMLNLKHAANSIAPLVYPPFGHGHDARSGRENARSARQRNDIPVQTIPRLPWRMTRRPEPAVVTGRDTRAAGPGGKRGYVRCFPLQWPYGERRRPARCLRYHQEPLWYGKPAVPNGRCHVCRKGKYRNI